MLCKRSGEARECGLVQGSSSTGSAACRSAQLRELSPGLSRTEGVMEPVLEADWPQDFNL